jgi:hypothetical protein
MDNPGIQFMMTIIEFVAGVFVVLGAIALFFLLIAGLTALLFDLPSHLARKKRDY